MAQSEVHPFSYEWGSFTVSLLCCLPASSHFWWVVFCKTCERKNICTCASSCSSYACTSSPPAVAGRAAVPAVRTVTPAQGCVLQSTCSPTQQARLLLLPVVSGSLCREQPSAHRAACSGACRVFAWACSCLSAAVQTQPCLPCSPRPLLAPQLCSLRCSGLATPQLGKQELILPISRGLCSLSCRKQEMLLYFSPK